MKCFGLHCFIHLSELSLFLSFVLKQSPPILNLIGFILYTMLILYYDPVYSAMQASEGGYYERVTHGLRQSSQVSDQGLLGHGGLWVFRKFSIVDGSRFCYECSNPDYLKKDYSMHISRGRQQRSQEQFRAVSPLARGRNGSQGGEGAPSVSGGRLIQVRGETAQCYDFFDRSKIESSDVFIIGIISVCHRTTFVLFDHGFTLYFVFTYFT